MSLIRARARGTEYLFSKLLTAMIFVSGLLLALGLISAWFFVRIDRNYSRLIARTAADLQDVHEIAFHGGNSYAHFVELPFTADPGRKAELLQTIAREKTANDTLFDHLDQTMVSPDMRALLDDARSKRIASRKEYRAFLKAVEHGEPLDIASPESRQLNAAFVTYQDACEKLAERIEADSLQASAQLTKDVTLIRWLFIGFGILPLILVLGFVLVIIYLICATPIEVELHEGNSADELDIDSRLYHGEFDVTSR
jgi:Four helix bundle sensory module for signal transduction